MPTFIAATGGGTWSSGSTWVGGVAPSNSINDDVIFNSSSGDVWLTGNVFNVGSLQFDGGGIGDFYAGTFSSVPGGGWTIQINGSGTMSFSPSMSIGSFAAFNIYVSGTNAKVIPNGYTWSSWSLLQLANSPKTLIGDFNFEHDIVATRSVQWNNTHAINAATSSLNFWGNKATGGNQTINPAQSGSAKVILKQPSNLATTPIITNPLMANSSTELIIDCGSGTWSFNSTTATLQSSAKITWVSGNVTGSPRLRIDGSNTGVVDTAGMEWFRVFMTAADNNQQTFNCLSLLRANQFVIIPADPGSGTQNEYRILGPGGLSASTLYITHTRPFSSGLVYNPLTTWQSGVNHYFGNIFLYGSEIQGVTLRSSTASSPATFNISGSQTQSAIQNASITDIDFVAPYTLYAGSSTLLRTTGATTSFPSGGGGGPSSTTFLM